MVGPKADRPRTIGGVRFQAVAIVLVAGALLSSGCSEGGEEGVSASCRQGSAALSEALRDAPGRVTLGRTPLSDCIKDTSRTADLHDVGQAYVYVAARLADVAAEDPDGTAAMQLGYLMGALRRGRVGAQGVGYELTRRMRSEVQRVDVSSPAFRRGERAGRKRG
jgi:hypothetical protein